MMDIADLKSILKKASEQELLPRYQKVQSQSKQDGSLLTQADLGVQNYIKNQLSKTHPDYGFFAEELSDKEKLHFFEHNQSGFWCLDPLDGTSNFVAGLPYFAISLALIINNETQLGLVYDPNRDEMFFAKKGQGAFLNEKPLQANNSLSNLSDCIALVDLKRLSPELVTKIALKPPFRSQRSFGAAALDWCWLAANRCQLFLHGKQMLWDYAAGLLIAQEAGCSTCALDGGDIFEQSLVSKKVVGSVNKNLQQKWFDFIRH